MPYIGHEPTNAGNFYILDDFNGLGQDGSSSTYDQNANGTIVNFKLMVAGVALTPNVDNLIVTIDGVLQHPTDAYSISGSILTFTEAPASGVDFHVVIMGQSATVGEGSIGADELEVSGDGTDGQLLKTDGDGTFSWINQNTVTASTANVATHVTVADNESTNENNLLTFVEDASGAGNVGLESDGDLHYNPSTGRLTATQLTGTLQTAAQTNITSVGTLTALTGGTGDLIWDTTTLVVDSSANKVGIGTASPATTLHITENTNSNLEIDGSVAGEMRLISINDARNAYEDLVFYGDTVKSISSEFHVSGSGSPSIRVTDTTNTVTGKFQADDSVGKVGTHTNHAFEIFTNNSTKMSITSGGNVLINHTAAADGLSATATLSTVNFPSQRNDMVIDTYQAGGEMSTLWFRKSDSDTKGTKTSTASGRNLGSIYFQGVDGAGNFDYGAGIEVVQNSSASTRCSADMKFYTSDGTNIPERVRIPSVGGIAITGDFHDSATADESNYQISFGGDAVTSPRWGFRVATSSNDEDLYLDRNLSGTPAVCMAWDKVSGNVGIGTTSPSQVLTIKHSEPSILFIHDNTELGFIGDCANFLTGSSPSASSFGVRSDGDFRIGTGGNNLRMLINSSGNVGIGDPSPDYRLDVEGDDPGSYIASFTNDGDSENRYGVRIQCGHDNASDTNFAITIADGDGGEQGYVTFTSGTITWGAFTANHDAELPSSDNSDGYPYGTLVETENLFYTKNHDGSDLERGIRYKVKKTSSAYSKKILGAYAGKYPTNMYENQHQIYVLGDGHILCNGEKGNIEVGDGICSSSTDGEGMKADKMAMIIGIAQEDVSFSGSESKLVAVQYGLQQFTPWESE